MTQPAPDAPIRVLVVDDSALVRSILRRGLEAAGGIEVVGAAQNPYEARDLLVSLRPDVVTLDVEMPRMDGIRFLDRYMTVLPTPTIVLSSLTPRGSMLAMQALEAGAVEVLCKPSAGVADGLERMMSDLVARVRVAAVTRVGVKERPVERPADRPQGALDETTDKVIAFGASTGGVAALGRILPAFPPWTPGIVVVQHMPEGFTRAFAERMDHDCAMRVSEARDGDRVLAGHILVAPGGQRHTEVHRVGGQYLVRLVDRPRVQGHVPSVDVLFESLAVCAARNATGCILTGMGADGAMGLLRMRGAGGRTLAQDRETSAVWGMPAAAHEVGAAERLVPLHEIPAAVLALAGTPLQSASARSGTG